VTLLSTSSECWDSNRGFQSHKDSCRGILSYDIDNPKDEDKRSRMMMMMMMMIIIYK